MGRSQINALDDLIERITIKFPRVVKVEEIRGKFVNHFASTFEVSYETKSHVDVIKGKNQATRQEEYPLEIRIMIRKGTSLPIYFEPNLIDDYCTEGRFDVLVPGYDDLKEFIRMPSGVEKIRLIDEFRREAEKYFSS